MKAIRVKAHLTPTGMSAEGGRLCVGQEIAHPNWRPMISGMDGVARESTQLDEIAGDEILNASSPLTPIQRLAHPATHPNLTFYCPALRLVRYRKGWSGRQDLNL